MLLVFWSQLCSELRRDVPRGHIFHGYEVPKEMLRNINIPM